MEIGVYYYPEHWPREQWERDLKNISKLGFSFTHFGEFAWALMEPEEGKYDFAWLDEALAIAAKNNVRVIMCTPTPTPPLWLTQKHPEILMVDENGRQIQHGSRSHASWSSAVYRQYVEKIVNKLAQKYGNDLRVWGWQLDNEPSHYGAYDYSPAAQANFRKWLQTKYGTIDELNRIWGTVFWSQKYQTFDQIQIPNPKQFVQPANPHAMLDFKRFSADEVAAFLEVQRSILRKNISPKQWITTNFMASHAPVDPWRNANLDMITYTTYPVSGYESGVGKQGFRMGNPQTIGMANALFHPINGVSGVMELQVGQVNWGGLYNPQQLPGAVRMWLWHVFAGGHSLTCTYRYRQARFGGGEQYAIGVVGPDGVTPTRGGLEYQQVIGEMNKLKAQYDPKAQMPAQLAARKTAFLWSPDNEWEIQFQPQTQQWDTRGHIAKYFNAATSFGAPVSYINEQTDFSQYPVLVAPAYELLDQKLVEKWKAYAEGGGHLVLTCRTGQKDRNGHLWEAKWVGVLQELIGAEILYFDLMPPDNPGTIKVGDQTYSWNNWGDIIEAKNGTTVLAAYADQYYAGKAAAITRKLGKGTVTYIGIDTDDGKLEKELLRGVFGRAGIAVEDYPAGVVTGWRDGFSVALNYSSDMQEIKLPDNAQVLIGEKTLPPAGVVIWKMPK